MKKLILLLVLFPIICLAQKKIPNQKLISNCIEITEFSEKEDTGTTFAAKLPVSAEIKNNYLVIHNYDQNNGKEKSCKILKLISNEANEVVFTIDFDGNIHTVNYNSANEGNKKTLLITDALGNFTLYTSK